MGLLLLSDFSSIPNLRAKIQSRREQKERYTPTFAEWGFINGTQRIVSGQSLGTSTLLFTVPEGEVLYITSCFMSIENQDNGKREANLQTGDFVILTIQANASPSVNSNSLSFTMPIRVEAGKTVSIEPSPGWTTVDCQCGFTGFTIEKSLEIV